MNKLKRFETGFVGSATGNPVTLDNALAKPMSYQLSGNTKHTIEIDGNEYVVPDGYTMLDYIESSGTQWINTGKKPYEVSKWELDAQFTELITTEFAMNGSYPTSDNKFDIGIMPAGYFWMAIGWEQCSVTWDTNRHIFILDRLNAIAYIDSTKLTYPLATWDTTATDTIYLANRSAYNSESLQFVCKEKVYSSKMWDNSNVLVQCLIPAKRTSDSAIGMYDFVTNTFFTNIGTGSFVAGNELPTPTNQLGVKSVGDKTANLFDKSNPNIVKQAYIPNNTSGTIVRSSSDRLIYIPCEPSTTYSVLFGTSYTKRIASSSVIPAIGVNVTNCTGNFSNNTRTYTTDSTAQYLAVQLFIDGDVASSGAVIEDAIQTLVIVEGSTAPTEYIQYGYKFPLIFNNTTTYTIYDDSQLMKVGTYADTIESDGTRTNNIKKVTLSAGTSTISDAMTNSPYICTQQVNGTLSGQSITLNTGVSNADVYYVLGTATEESVTTPSISTVAGTNYLGCTTIVPVSELSATYRSKVK